MSLRADLTRELGECAFNDDIVHAHLAIMERSSVASDREILISMVKHMVQNRKELRQMCVRLTETQTPVIHLTCQRCGFTPPLPAGVKVEDASE